ncbi:MAG: hypothetical protein GC151_07165 [Betaproteobacteria bacterium]|nr:hypothetical protein [Betaproteobacteria bacterium]
MNSCDEPVRDAFQRVAQLLALLAIILAGAGTHAAHAEVEGWSREHLGAVIRQAQQSDGTYVRMREELVKARQAPGLLLRTEAGGYVYISDTEAERLSAAVALRAMLYGTEDDKPYRPVAPGRSELEIAIDAVEVSVLDSIGGPSRAVTSEQARANIAARTGELARDALLKILRTFDAENRARIAQEIARIDRAREWLAAVVARADTLREEALSDGTANGFLNHAGYYVARFAGSGWRKRYSGYAHHIEGFQAFVLKVEDRTGDPKWEGSYWSFPTGVDIWSVFTRWKSDVREKSLKRCQAPPPNCPCGAEPDIWTSGPDYRVVGGPFRTVSEARSRAGDPYLENGKPGANKHWTYDTERRIAEVESACRTLQTTP